MCDGRNGAPTEEVALGPPEHLVLKSAHLVILLMGLEEKRIQQQFHDDKTQHGDDDGAITLD
eukprot:1914563-Pleurochrysis_carterae.AAC.2